MNERRQDKMNEMQVDFILIITFGKDLSQLATANVKALTLIFSAL